MVFNTTEVIKMEDINRCFFSTNSKKYTDIIDYPHFISLSEAGCKNDENKDAKFAE